MDRGLLAGNPDLFVLPGEELTPLHCSLVIRSGWVGITMKHHTAERVVGLMLPGDRPQNAMGATKCRALALTPVFLTTKQPEIEQAGREQEHLLRQCLRAQLTAAERFEDFLVETYERLSSAGSTSNHKVDLPVTNEQISRFLGMTSVHLSSTIKKLKSTGRIRSLGRSFWILGAVRDVAPDFMGHYAEKMQQHLNPPVQ